MKSLLTVLGLLLFSFNLSANELIIENEEHANTICQSSENRDCIKQYFEKGCTLKEYKEDFDCGFYSLTCKVEYGDHRWITKTDGAYTTRTDASLINFITKKVRVTFSPVIISKEQIRLSDLTSILGENYFTKCIKGTERISKPIKLPLFYR